MITFINETNNLSFSNIISFYRKSRKYGIQDFMNYSEFTNLYQATKKKKRKMLLNEIVEGFDPDLYIEDLDVIFKKDNKYYDTYSNLLFLSESEIATVNNIYLYDITEKHGYTIFKRRR